MNKKLVLKIVSGLTLCSMVGYTLPVFAYTKDETVYSRLDTTGNSYKTIVSTHIKNSEKNELINDMSDLLNIKNTNGDETYTQDGNRFVWNANKNDIYYQGETSKELPIECKVIYELDGKEIASDDIVGKSGNIKIKLQYTNKEERIVDINGKKVKMYVPFVVVAGTIIKNENNSNITVSNGKVVDDGTKTTVIGMAMPGLQESLGVSNDEIEIPSNIEITMDAKDFEMGTIMSYITPKVLEDNDLNIFDDLNDIYSQVNLLQSSSKQLEDGANTLEDGAKTYSQKSKEFNSAMNKVSDGVSTVNSNYAKIDNGINKIDKGTSTLTSGAEQLNSGIGELSSQLENMPSSVEALYNGTTQVLDGLNGSAQEAGLVDGVNSVLSNLQTTTNGLEEALTQASDGSTNAIALLQANNAALNSAIQALSVDTEANSTAIEGLRQQIAANESAIQSYTVAKNTADTKKTYVQNQAQASVTSLTKLRNGMAALQSSMTQINGGLGKLNEGACKLPGALQQLSNGSKQIVTGTKKLSSGTDELSKGSLSLKDGIQTLDSSTKVLNDANGQLTQGAETLAEGAAKLSDGVTRFNKEGIQKICDFINGDAKDLTERVEKLTELSKDYNNFTLLNEGNEGEVKFIMIIDSLKQKTDSEQDKEEAILNTDVLKNNK